MDYSFLDRLNVTAYVIDRQLKLLYINQTAAKRYKNAGELIGQSILDCHKREGSRQKIIEMLNEFEQGRREPYNYYIKKGTKIVNKVILPYYHEGVFQGLVEFMYLG